MKKTIILAISILLAASVVWAGSPFVVGGGGSGIQTASDCDQAAYYAIGTLCQDTDDGKLYKGTGAAVAEVAATGIAADGSANFTGQETFEAGLTTANGTDSSGFVEFTEDGTNGTNYARLYGPVSLSGNIQYILPNSALARGSFMVGSSTANTWGWLAVGAANTVIATNGTDPAWSAYTITPGTNTFAIANGTASLDIAAGATLNIDTSLQVATGAVVLNGNAGGSSVLTLPNQTLILGTMTNAKLCQYTAASTTLSCDVDPSGGTPTVITVADTTDTTSYVALFESATGDLGPKTDAGITYNATTGMLTVTGLTTGAGGITTAASASPTVLLNDSDAPGTDKEIAKIVGAYIDGADGSENGTVSIYAHEAGTTTEYIQADGKNVRVDLLKPVYAASTVTVGGQLNLMTTDADPATTAGGIKHDSSSTESQTTARGVLKWFDGTSVRTIADIGTDSTIITKTEFLPIRYAEDGSAAPAAAAAVTGKVVIARSFTDGKDVVFFWSVPNDYVGGGDVKYRVHYALSTDASADDTVTFTMTGCAIANSANIACTAGTGLSISDELGTDDDQYQYMVTDYSAASNADWGIAAGGFAKLGLSYSDGDYDAAALVIGIEIKYKAKLVGFAGY